MALPDGLPGCSAVRSLVADASDGVLLVTESPALIGCLVTMHPRGRWRLLSTRDTLDAVARVAYLGWSLRTRQLTDPLQVRTVDTVEPPSALIDRECLVVIVAVDGALFTIHGEDPALTAAVRSSRRAAWERATQFAVRVPGRRRVERILADHLGRSVSTLTADVLEAIWPAQLAGTGPDTLEVIVLVAARYDCRLQQVGDCAEAIGLGSRGEVSRVKRRLAEVGLVETTAIDGEIGRPPLRLHLNDAGVEALPPGPLATVGQMLLGE